MALAKKALGALWALANYVLATTNMSARINQKATVAQRSRVQLRCCGSGSSVDQWCSGLSGSAHMQTTEGSDRTKL